MDIKLFIKEINLKVSLYGFPNHIIIDSQHMLHPENANKSN